MKKIVLASIVILSAFFTSCAKSNLVVEPDGANTLRAVMENSDDSRTTLDDGRNVIWSSGDKLSVFNKDDQSQQAEYTLIQGEGTTSAVFQSNKPLGAGVKYAFYPASAEVACAADVISFDLPATQIYAKASFANGSNPMVAKSNAQGDLSFQNLCGMIKFQLTGTKTVASVVMQTAAGEVVAGDMTVNMGYTDVPAMEVAKTGTTSTSITLTDCNVSLSESVNSTFYFTVPAGTYAPGLTFTAYDKADEVIRTKATSSELKVSRSHIASLPGTSENLYFPDANFRAKLVALGFEETADKTDVDITNPVNAKLLKETTLNVGNITTNAVSKAAAAKPMISSLKGIEYFTELTSLDCDGNSLTALDVSANKKLTTLKCGNNLLPALDIKANTLLATLECGNNKLEELILTNNTKLTSLTCSNNQLKALDIRATSITEANKLNCGEQTSDGSTSQNIYLSVTEAQKTAGLVTGTGVTRVNFPDANFRAKLVALDFELNKDGTDIDITNATNANLLATLKWPDLSSANITDLTGIEHFTELTSLFCMNNKLTELNISALTKLQYVYCANNKLTKLDVSNNKTIEELECYNNTLTDLKVSGCTALTLLRCESNKLTELNVNGCTKLTELRCNTNLLTGLTLNTALATLDCHSNQLKTLSVSGCSVLTKLFCHENKLTTLTLNTALKNLHCHDNLLETLTLNAALTELRCYNNQLNALDVSDCTALKTLKCSGNKLNALDLNQNGALKVLDCSGNTFTNGLDVSHNGALTELVCSGNALTALTLTANKALSTLHCQNNQLEELTLTDNDKVEYLFCYGNRMSALNITTLSKLTALQCGLQTTNGTTAKDLELTLTQAQSDKSLSTGTNNDRVNQIVKP